MTGEKEKILIVTGATATGKSEFAVELAKELDGEVVGADSVQIYKRLDIGSGKVTESEKQGIPHHMIDILQPFEEFSVSDYVFTAKAIINDITKRGKLPIIVGGTGLYIKCLLEGHNFAEAPKDESLRNYYKQLLLEKGKEFLHEKLRSIDTVSAERISVNDTKRVIRALEIFDLTGVPKSSAVKTKESDYDYKMLVLYKEREELYSRINQRVDKMFDLGLIEEVESLIEYKDCQSMQSIGYKEISSYLSCIKEEQGSVDLDDTKEQIKQNSRRYAKRQMTFFRGMNCEKKWVDTSTTADIAIIMRGIIAEFK